MTTATTTAGFLTMVRPDTFIRFSSADVAGQLDLPGELYVTEGYVECVDEDGDVLNVVLRALDPDGGKLLPGSVEVELPRDQMIEVEA